MENFAALINTFVDGTPATQKMFANTHIVLMTELRAYKDAGETEKPYRACAIKGMQKVLQYSDNQAVRELSEKAEFLFLQIQCGME